MPYEVDESKACWISGPRVLSIVPSGTDLLDGNYFIVYTIGLGINIGAEEGELKTQQVQGIWGSEGSTNTGVPAICQDSLNQGAASKQPMRVRSSRRSPIPRPSRT